MKRSLNNKAFSLIELLIVVSLLAILSLMLIIGIDKLRTNSKRQQTHLLLLNLQAMFSEADSVRHIPFGIGHLNFNSITDQSSMLKAIAMDCPGNVTTGSPDRFGTGTTNPNPAVRYTHDFMAMLMQFPVNAAGIGKLSAGSLMTFPATTYNTMPANWSVGTKYNVGGATLINSNACEAGDGNGNYYIRTQVYTDTSGNILVDDSGANGDSSIGPPNSSYWLAELPQASVASPTLPLSIPVALDAWGNPIIFVFGGVLGNGAPLSATGTVTLNSGAMIAGGRSFQQASPDYRPFFASAGPDGDFSKGDDNMYSYEK